MLNKFVTRCRSKLFSGRCHFRASSRQMSSIQEKIVKVNGENINYVQAGNGPKNVFLLPGALGTVWSDFKPQIEGLNQSKLTIYAWDPPGYGKSRPPNKTFSLDFFKQDAASGAALMKTLGVEKYSLLGWSDGGITALILAANFARNIDKLVVWGANAYVTKEDIALYEAIRDTSKWSVKMREPLEAMYGADGLQGMWSGWIDCISGFLENRSGDICRQELSRILCPMLIIHGDKDPMVPSFHPEYLLKQVNGSRIHHFPDGKHNLHLKYAKEFNRMVEDFIYE